MYYPSMPRASTTSDAFNAVAEPRRRDILSFLAFDERSVSEIVDALALEQPSVSKHLRVLRDVGLVSARRDGRNILYRTQAEALRPLHEWTKTFERLWTHQLHRIKDRAERAERAAEKDNHQ
jgi:DNA-binding transcriptional ArsR family regulator